MDAQINFDSQIRAARKTQRESSLAFIVEALVLLLFLIGSLAIITQLFSLSANKATQSKHLEQGVIVASNVAERFSANPKGVEEMTNERGLAVSCSVTEENLAYGTRYDALITVFDDNGEVYRLTTSRYVPTSYEKITAYVAANPQGADVGATDSGASGNTGSAGGASSIGSTTPPASTETPVDPGAAIEVIEE